MLATRTVGVSLHMADELTPQLAAEFRQAFSLFDKNGTGSIVNNDLRMLLMLLGMGQTESEIERMILEADDDKSGTIDEDEFLELMAKLMRDTETEEEITEAFRPIDEHQDGRVTVKAIYEGLGLTLEEQRKLPEAAFREHVGSVTRVAADDTIEYKTFVRTMLMRK